MPMREKTKNVDHRYTKKWLISPFFLCFLDRNMIYMLNSLVQDNIQKKEEIL